ncbi:MAG: hypothetical protein HQK84_11595, partial [Nitrospinae bacterium]|nr:hypothetical protein [Nitrospinota bacterium]
MNNTGIVLITLLLLFIGLPGCHEAWESDLKETVAVFNEGKTEEAEKEITTLVKKYPNNPQLFYFSAYVHFKNNKYQQALDDSMHLLQLKRDYNDVVGDVKFSN